MNRIGCGARMTCMFSIWLLVTTVAVARGSLVDVAPIAAGMELMAAGFDPGGERIVASGLHFRGLYILDMDGTTRCLTDRPMAGFGYCWLPSGAGIVYRTWDGRDAVCEKVSLSGAVATVGPLPPGALPCRQGETVFLPSGSAPAIVHGAAAPEALVFATAVDDRIVLNRGPRATIIAPEGDRYFLPVVSPTSSHVVFQGLISGIWIHDINRQATINIGPGHNPAWSPDGRYLYFDRQQDDGERVLAADLWRVRCDGSDSCQLTFTEDRLEMRPSVSPAGDRLLFDCDGVIWTARLEEE
ncbi:PD40 domain-containing protein [bacterium]|nr:PD40 domain-containing protein [candidate division CSSED10-310 bacterium]